ncbi:DNA binding domain%2C excisionase family [uncultured Clostridium sp.]|nr:DNA binding domain%2C excisionase family [uncultured Clostridium sp.]
MTQRKIALSIEEAADYTGIGRNTLRQLVEWKKLPVLKVGRKVLIKTDILEMFMEANEGRDLRDRGNVKAVTRTVAKSPPPVKQVARDAGSKPALLGRASRRWLSLFTPWEVYPL